MSASVYTAPQRQFELPLCEPETDGLLRERLAGLVEILNARSDLGPGEVVEIKREIDRLRAMLHPARKAGR